jgi:hypothetical protein
MAGARWFVNPVLKEIIMPLANPRRRGRRGGNWATAWLGNRRRHRHHRRHRRNPGGSSGSFGVMTLASHPSDVIIGGTVGAASGFLALALPNWLLPFPGVTIMDRVLRLASRAAAGGLVYTAVKKFAPRYSGASLAVITAAVGGGFVLDMLGITLAIGRGDTSLQPGQLIPSGFTWPSFTGYSVPQGYAGVARTGGGVAMRGLMAPRYSTLAGYSRRQGMAGLYSANSYTPTGMGANLYP